jgi:hypothetical protein
MTYKPSAAAAASRSRSRTEPVGLSTIEVAINLDPEFSPGHLDGKLRISFENGRIEFRCDKARSPYTYLAASCSKEEIVRALGIIGVLP